MAESVKSLEEETEITDEEGKRMEESVQSLAKLEITDEEGKRMEESVQSPEEEKEITDEEGKRMEESVQSPEEEKEITDEEGKRMEESVQSLSHLALTDLTVAVDSTKSGDQWKVDLSWSLQQGMEQGPQKFLISYCSKGAEPQTISTESCNATLTGLQPDTQYTASVCTETQSCEKIDTVSTTFHTSEWRIVLLGKSGDGKSSTGNTILGEDVFEVKSSPCAVTNKCEDRSKTINGRKITLIDTPGFLDPITKRDIEPEIAKCLTLSSPGPHAYIIVLKAARFTQGQMDVLNKILELFTSEVFNHALIVFTFGEELRVRGQTIKQFLEESSKQDLDKKDATLPSLVKKCGERYHVIDNRDWKERHEGEYSNRRQIEKLFDTIGEMVHRNGGGYYTEEQSEGVTGLQGLKKVLTKLFDVGRSHSEAQK